MKQMLAANESACDLQQSASWPLSSPTRWSQFVPQACADEIARWDVMQSIARVQSVFFYVLSGHADVVSFLTESCNVDPFVKDR